MKKFSLHIINESDVSFIEGEVFEEAVMDHLKEVVGINRLNIAQLRGDGANVYEITVSVNTGSKINIKTQINRFKEIKQLIHELFIVRRDFIQPHTQVFSLIDVKFHIEYVDMYNSNFYKSTKGIDKYKL